MPFTPSHAIVALPFLRTPLVPAAVAVGAMAPDLPLFVRGTPLDYATTHDLLWLPLTTAVALVLLLGWRMLLRPAVRELSPRPLAARLPGEWDAGASSGLRGTFARRGTRHPSWAGTALVAAALAIGVATHILWDEFTHEGRGGTVLFPALAEWWGPLHGYRWLQYGGGVVGVAILGVAAVVWLRRSTPDAATVRRVLPAAVRVVWIVALPAILILALVWGYAVYGPFGPDFTPSHLGYRVLPAASAVWVLGTLVLALVVQVRRARGR
ncbi:DUF4184 family protein [Microbacterium sp. X-17]|uniref:DUF4184 family protein n=1 Tax=Microbacterium sp. X-17 TaxID=3144404 RepID=UPI0031F53674